MIRGVGEIVDWIRTAFDFYSLIHIFKICSGHTGKETEHSFLYYLAISRLFFRTSYKIIGRSEDATENGWNIAECNKN